LLPRSGLERSDFVQWPFATFRVREQSGRFQVEADITWPAGPAGSVEIDP
jgi:hypothetical protein